MGRILGGRIFLFGIHREAETVAQTSSLLRADTDPRVHLQSTSSGAAARAPFDHFQFTSVRTRRPVI